MTEASYRIRYRKGDFEVEVQGDKEWVEEKFQNLIKEIPIKIAAPTASLSQMSIVEFLKVKGNPKNHPDIAILFSYWLNKKKNLDSYNIDDIKKCYDEARITKPKNITDVMNRLQAKGYLEHKGEKDGKKAWIITQTGDEYVEKMKG